MKKRLFQSVRWGLLALSALPFWSAAQAAPVFYKGNGHYYEAVDAGTITWGNADAAAVSRTLITGKGLTVAAHLATITSATENQFLANTFPLAISGAYWLGGLQPDGFFGSPSNGWQ
jgi:hypothetical protein